MCGVNASIMGKYNLVVINIKKEYTFLILAEVQDDQKYKWIIAKYKKQFYICIVHAARTTKVGRRQSWTGRTKVAAFFLI